MQISLDFLEDELLARGFRRIKTNAEKLAVSSFRSFSDIYAQRKTAYADTLVLLEAHEVPDLFPDPVPKSVQDEMHGPAPAVIGVGAFSEADLAALGGCPWILLAPPELPLSAVWGMLTEICFSFTQWREDLLLQATRNSSLQNLLNRAAVRLRNPLAVFDSNFFIIARTDDPEGLPTGTIWDTFQNNSFRAHEFYSVEEQRRIARELANRSDHAYLLHPERDPYHCYYASSFKVDGVPSGTLGTVDLFAPISAGQIYLLEVIREAVELYLRLNVRKSSGSLHINKFFQSYLYGSSGQPQDAAAELAKMHWDPAGSFTLLSLINPVEYTSELNHTAFVNLISYHFPRAVLTTSDNIVTLILRTEDYDLDAPEYRKSIEQFLEANLICCGRSLAFSDISACQSYLPQSLFGARLAKKQGIYRIMDYRLAETDHILELLSEKQSLECFCDPVLLRLRNSKKDSDRVLIDCLYTYLINGRDLAETSRKLYMHRNTVIYRLNKLSALLHTDPGTMSDREYFYYLLSCIILRERTS